MVYHALYTLASYYALYDGYLHNLTSGKHYLAEALCVTEC